MSETHVKEKRGEIIKMFPKKSSGQIAKLVADRLKTSSSILA